MKTYQWAVIGAGPAGIAAGLFGLGIAFPEAKIDPFGMLESRVGLWKFMEYLHRVMPIWLNYAT